MNNSVITLAFLTFFVAILDPKFQFFKFRFQIRIQRPKKSVSCKSANLLNFFMRSP